jgi:hypothetical protein
LDVNDAGTENVGSIVTPVRLPFTNSSDMSYSTPSEYTMPLQAEDAHGDVTNLSASELKNKRSREWYASLTKEQKEDRNRKARDARRRRKDESQGNVPKATTSKFSTPTPTLGDISIVTAGDPAGREQWVSNDELLDTPTTKGTGSVSQQPTITPRRLPFTVINNIAYYDLNEGSEEPLSYIVQGETQNNNETDFLATNSGQDTQSRRTSLENSRNPVSRSLSQDQLQSRRAGDRAKYAAKTPEQKQVMLERQRSRRQSMTAEQKQEMNARLRVARQNLPDVDIHEMNARRRSRRQNVTPGERTAHLARRNARYAARRDKPCAESIALECPEGSSPSLLNPTPCLETTDDVPATSSRPTEHAADHLARSCTFDDGMIYVCFHSYSQFCTLPHTNFSFH